MAAAVLAALSLFGQAFAGTWTCGDAHFQTPWHIYAAPAANWTVVDWGPRTGNGGTAYVGYVPARKQWLYEDFHFDGSYSMNTSPGPVNGSWSWTGTYDMGKHVLHGVVIWKRATRTRIVRTFEQTLGGKVVHVAHDSCAAR